MPFRRTPDHSVTPPDQFAEFKHFGGLSGVSSGNGKPDGLKPVKRIYGGLLYTLCGAALLISTLSLNFYFYFYFF